MINLNIGAGSFSHPAWTNVDLPSERYKDQQAAGFIAHDLTTLADLPIESGTVDHVYCSHVIEHVSNDAVAKLLTEAKRVLKPGGGLRLVTPDIELAARNWLRNDALWFRAYVVHIGNDKAAPIETSTTQLFLHAIASQLTTVDLDTTPEHKFTDEEVWEVFTSRPLDEAMDYFSSRARFNPQRPENHINWFHADKLHGMLLAAGFTTVYRSGAGQSIYHMMRDLRFFDPHYTISLYMEASP